MQTYSGWAVVVLLAACGSVKNEDVDASVPEIDAALDASSPCAEACNLGCNISEARCNKLAPSNGLATAFDEAAQSPDLILVGAATIDTDSGAITDQSGSRSPPTSSLTTGLPIGVFVIKAKDVTLTNVSVTGSKALAIVASGTITISGRVSVSGRRDVSGPGSLDAACRAGSAGTTVGNGIAGGGGGGFGTTGAKGGNGGVPTVQGGTAGAISGNVEIVPLRGGCPGGHASGQTLDVDPVLPDPGGGGGAIQLVAGTEITIEASGGISANGGGGKTRDTATLCAINGPCGNGQGAGSGGAILLEAPLVTIAATGGLAANGGGGSCDVMGGGAAGTNTATPAAGQKCSGDTGSGGDGAAGTTAAASGTNGSGSNPVGGGGGGGAGRIRVNLPLSVPFAPAGVVSPAGTVGALGIR